MTISNLEIEDINISQVSYDPRSYKRNLRNRVCKFQGFNRVGTGDLAKPVRRSNQLNYEATDVGGWSFVGSNEPVRNECEVIYEIFHDNRYREVTGSNALETLNFSGFYIRNCINCVHNYEDHSLLDFTSAVQYMKYFIYNFTLIFFFTIFVTTQMNAKKTASLLYSGTTKKGFPRQKKGINATVLKEQGNI